MDQPAKARLALFAGVLLGAGWILWAMMYPAARVDQAQLEEMGKTLNQYKQEHGNYPENLDGIFREAEAARLEYEKTPNGFTLHSKVDKTVKIERETPEKSPGQNVRDKVKEPEQD